MTDKSKVLVPKFNPKGTPPKALYGRFYAAYEACFAAYQELRKCRPRSEDYPDGAATADGSEFTPGPFGLEKVSAQHMDRLERLAGVTDELEAIVEHLRATEPL